MQWSDFRNKRVILLGAGIENLSLVPHLERAGATVFVSDQRPAAVDDVFRHRHPHVKLLLEKDALAELGGYDYVFRSPGMPVRLVDAALANVKHVPVRTSATDLFLHLTHSVVIGVTGTKGKGTTSTMIGAILGAAGKKVVVAGNIGKPIFTILDDLDAATIVVLEMSSFQLEDITKSPHIAVVLPIAEDHLKPLSDESPNFHPSMNDYVAAKAQITVYQSTDDVIIFAADNPDATAIASVSKAKKVAVSQSAYQNHWNVGAQGEVFKAGEPFLNLADCALRGQHIYLNATIAAAVCHELGVSATEIADGLRRFEPLPHRLQRCGVVDGVTYVDDSYATNPEATIAALTSFTEPVVLIAGGSSKGADFTDLARKVKDSTVQAVVLIGQEAPRIKAALEAAEIDATIADGGSSMSSAVAAARQFTRAGTVVLLSPACASKDMFKSAADRGDQFQAEVSVSTRS